MKNEHSLFLDEMTDVIPLGEKDKKHKKKRRVSTPTPGQLAHRNNIEQPDEDDVVNYLTTGVVERVEPDSDLSWCVDGIQPKVFDKLRRGDYASDLTLDLHCKSVEEARDLVWEFILRMQCEEVRVATIVHGRGERSTPRAQLKSYVAHWLRQHRDVIAFHTTPSGFGSTGSVFVQIRKTKRSKQENREQFG